MHKDFADWYRPVTFGHDRGTLELRWKGVEEALSELEFAETLELVRIVFHRPIQSAEFEDKFRNFFKNADSTFSNKGNDHEMRVLAACVLALYCVDAEYSLSEVALAVLTASACNIRKPDSVEIDLIGMAAERVRLDGVEARKRPRMEQSAIESCNKVIKEKSETLQASTDIATVVGALLPMWNAQKAANQELIHLKRVLSIQDEELEMLWWMVSGWSGMWNSTFTAIDSKVRPILLAKEASTITEEFTESPSLRAVLSRILIDGNQDVTIPDALNACGVDRLKKLAIKNAPCFTIYPVHSAIDRALETGADKSWIAGWDKVSGVSGKARVSLLDLAIQFHREIKLMALDGAADE